MKIFFLIFRKEYSGSQMKFCSAKRFYGQTVLYILHIKNAQEAVNSPTPCKVKAKHRYNLYFPTKKSSLFAFQSIMQSIIPSAAPLSPYSFPCRGSHP